MSSTRSALAAALFMVMAPIVLPAPSAAVTLRNVVLKANKNDEAGGTNYSACWSYVHGDGREYAVLGTYTGTRIYNVTDPDNVYSVGFIAGPLSTWREMKSYRNWIYVVTEGTGAGEGLQIIRMTNPESPVLAATYTTGFTRSHTVAVDTARAILVCNGTRNGTLATGVRVLSLSTPEAPVPLSTYPSPIPGGGVPSDQYVHDSVPIGNRLYASSIYAGIQRIFDFTNPAAPTQISFWTYPGGFTHNAWPDATGNFLYVTDEVNGEPLKVFDISTPTAPVLANAFTSNDDAIVHNAHVMGNDLYLANYTEGIRILDLTDPRHPAEFGYADSYPGPSGFYDGVWDVCPFFPSGTVIASDRQTGLYVYRLERNYGLLRVRVELDGASAAGGVCSMDGEGCCCAPDPCTCPDHVMEGPAAGVKVVLTTQGDSLTTASDGVVMFAPNPGVHTLKTKKYGYGEASVDVTIASGVLDSVVITLTALPTSAFSGTVRNATTQEVLEGAEVNLAETPVHLHTNASGAFSDPAVPEDEYRVEVRRPGFVPLVFDRTLGPGPTTQDFQLTPVALWDALEVASGWLVGNGSGHTGDNASSGIWTRVEPLGTGQPQTATHAPGAGPGGQAPSPGGIRRRDGAGLFHEDHHEDEGLDPGEVQPEFDRTPPPGTLCFVTGQGTNPGDVNQADVDFGTTTLRTPLLNTTGMTTPTISYWWWFYSSGDHYDIFDVSITNNNGASWVPVETHRGTHNHNHWTEKVVRVADHVTPTSQVRLRFQASDLGNPTIVEAAVDDLSLYDGSAIAVGTPGESTPARLAFRAPSPNPSRGVVAFGLDVPAAGPVTVEVLDLQGRRIAQVFDGVSTPGTLALRWDGSDERGSLAAAGVYYARARAAGSEATTRFVRIR